MSFSLPCPFSGFSLRTGRNRNQFSLGRDHGTPERSCSPALIGLLQLGAFSFGTIKSWSSLVIVNLISATPTQTGLEVRAKLDTNAYPPGAKVSKKEIAEINIRPDSFHGEWNYTIRPNSAVT